ncbi:MAG: hypothetical protein FWD48_04005 [Oscillospiraceae bacterium]|nr:hypothetical protein [Oscillospiraceae bacterium]
MLSKKQIEGLKRGNVSVNAELTKARVAEDYRAASTANKKAIRELASAPNFNSVVAKSGAISAKYVVAMAQVLGVSPYYYTGESDDKKPFTGEIMQGFYDKHKDSKSASAKPKAVKKAPAAKKTTAKTAKSAASKAKPTKTEAKVETKKPAVKAVKPAAPKKTKTASVKSKAAKPVAGSKPKAEKPTAPARPLKADTALFSIQLDNSAKMNKAVAALDEDGAVILLKALSCKAKAGGDAEILYDALKRCLLS